MKNLRWQVVQGQLINFPEPEPEKIPEPELKHVQHADQISSYVLTPQSSIDTADKPLDQNTAIQLNYAKCVGCQMCAKTCSDHQNFNIFQKSSVKVYPFVNSRGDVLKDETRFTLECTDCVGCGACVQICPTGALQPRDNVQELSEKLQCAEIVKIAVIAPSTRVGIAEGMGMPVGSSAERQMVQALKNLGFDYVFDNMFGADMTTREDAQEILKHKAAGTGPCFTSCCPAWVNLVERQYPELIPRLSTARSPHGMICSVIKKQFAKSLGKRPGELFVAGFMPCTAKKFEAARPQLATDGVQDCDLSLTTREMMTLFKGQKFSVAREAELENDESAQYSAPYNRFSGSAYIYGKSAGVTEAVARYIFHTTNTAPSEITSEVVFEDIPSKSRISLISFTADQTYRVLVAQGGLAAHKVVGLAQEVPCDAVEVMVCPGGCIGGGGQPKQLKKELVEKRKEGLELKDSQQAWKSCCENEGVQAVYAEMGDSVHDVLHTYFVSSWE
ncbi:FeFe-hydrogenase 2 [Spironucleus salmonicida]|nr:FeFe-hydrogenase 2 [Spironucleus salmonicida]|eukprot:EST48803.1 [FeFe]-hydrogenase 2 [Spironucleus salmonicida]